MGWKDDILKYHVFPEMRVKTKLNIGHKAFHENDATIAFAFGEIFNSLLLF